MKTSPYIRLRNIASEWAQSVICADRKLLWTYVPSSDLGYSALKQRIIAAHQLGYHVRLETLGDSIVVMYVKNPPTRPIEF